MFPICDIHSNQNPFLKKIEQLIANPQKYQESLLLEGVHLAQETIKYLKSLEQQQDIIQIQILISDESLKNQEIQGITADLEQLLQKKSSNIHLNIKLHQVSSRLFANYSAVKPQILMVLPSNTLHIKQNLILESLILESSMQKSVFQLPQHHIVLDGIQDPGNLGTILRTAAAVGIKNIICLKGTTYPFAPKVLRAAMGAHFHLNIKIGLQYNEFSDFLIEQSNYQSHNIQAYALTLEDAVSFYDIAQIIEKRNRSNHDTHFYWIFGNEGAGVNQQLLTHLENLVHFKKVFIPQSSAVESLNVGIACSVVLYELLRQKIQGANTM